jgi:linoleoyl-CoA desaturase
MSLLIDRDTTAVAHDTQRETDVVVSARMSRSELVFYRRVLHIKALSIGLVFALGYALLLVGPSSWWSLLLGSFLVVNGSLAAATGVMHDANHSAFSKRKATNSVASCVADLLGASSWLWRFQHNLAHHRHTNVVGLDDDIEQMPFLRLTQEQPRRSYMRFQHIYAWVLYSFLTVKWLLVGDFMKIMKRESLAAGTSFKIQNHHRVAVVAGKLSHVAWALVLPLFFHGWASVLIVYAVCAASVGVVLATVFQLAHCVDRAEVMSLEHGLTGHRGFEHQVRTTVNIRWRNPVSRAWAWWLFGGLDRQIEHHLSPRSPHTSYKRLSSFVRAECDKRGLEYREHDGLFKALQSHYRHLRQMAL